MRSIFAGWTKKIEGKPSDGQGGYCAAGFLAYVRKFQAAQMMDVAARIGGWIQENCEAPVKYDNKDGCILYPRRVPRDAFVWANNEKILDIEGFKRVDRLTRAKRGEGGR